MNSLPRLAIAAIDEQTDCRPLLWALLGQLESDGIQSQVFLAESRFAANDGVASVTGRAYRHLDAALMSSELCREVMVHGSHGADLSIVEAGSFVLDRDEIDRLCHWLELPRIAVVDVAGADPCCFPVRAEYVDGVFITGAASHRHLVRERLRWEALWGVPVLGGLVDSAHIDAIVRRLPTGSQPSAEVLRALRQRLVLTNDADALLSLSHRPDWLTTPPHVFRTSPAMDGLKVAVAYDDAFHCYFADTLDLLELNGATLRDFSPLADQDLPSGTDVVFLGCGHVEHFAHELAANPCMMSALRRHARQGGRIYAEGGAAAYLCQDATFEDGSCVQMCGILPASADRHPMTPEPELLELDLAQSCWLGRAGDRLRGYQNAGWNIQPHGPLWTIASDPTLHSQLLCRDNVIASQVHLNLVAQPHLLQGFASATAATVAR